jgi:hypothetical protein
VAALGFGLALPPVFKGGKIDQQRGVSAVLDQSFVA